MEDSLASQLPEADALPDGFAESFSATSDYTKPAVESDNPRLGQEDKVELDGLNSISELRIQKPESVSSLYPDSSIETAASMSKTAEFCIGAGTGSPISVEKAQKARTFPVPLSDKDAGDSHDGMGKSAKKDFMDHTGIKLGNSMLESTAMNASDDGHFSPTKSHSSPNVPLSLPTADELTVDPCQNTDHVETGSLKSNQSAGRELEKKVVKAFGYTTEQDNNDDLKSLKQVSASEMKVKQSKGTSKIERELLDLHQKHQQVVIERDAALVELRKNIAVREKLESLCRELQRQNKMLTDECKKVSTEGQQKRLELSTQFHEAIKDVSNKLEEQRDERLSQLKENEMLREKLKQFSEQYEICEQQFMQQLKKKTLELQLAEVKLQQQEEASCQEQAKMQLYTEQITQLLGTEKNLRLQLAADGEKFQQFQDTLTKSNEVFESFKKEMEKMAKTIKDLNKENNFLKSKCEKSDVSLIELVEERSRLKKQLEKVKNQKEKLESLCRSLQLERKQQGVVNANCVITETLAVSVETNPPAGQECAEST